MDPKHHLKEVTVRIKKKINKNQKIKKKQEEAADEEEQHISNKKEANGKNKKNCVSRTVLGY